MTFRKKKSKNRSTQKATRAYKTVPKAMYNPERDMGQKIFNTFLSFLSITIF